MWRVRRGFQRTLSGIERRQRGVPAVELIIDEQLEFFEFLV